MDTQELEAITKKMDKALLAFYQSGAKDDLQVVAAGLDELASRHVYFELLRLDRAVKSGGARHTQGVPSAAAP